MNTSDKVNLHFHFILSSYVADALEVDDILNVKRGSRKYSSCNISLAY